MSAKIHQHDRMSSLHVSICQHTSMTNNISLQVSICKHTSMTNDISLQVSICHHTSMTNDISLQVSICRHNSMNNDISPHVRWMASLCKWPCANVWKIVLIFVITKVYNIDFLSTHESENIHPNWSHWCLCLIHTSHVSDSHCTKQHVSNSHQ